MLAGGDKKHLGVDTDFFVRTAKELNAAIAANPFPAEAKSDPGHLVLLFLKDTPAWSAVTALQGAIAGRETLEVKGPHAYVFYRDGIGNSKLTNVMIGKKLARAAPDGTGTRCSNWRRWPRRCNAYGDCGAHVFPGFRGGDFARRRKGIAAMLSSRPELATVQTDEGASRAGAPDYFLGEIAHYVYAGDTALHVAAAAFEAGIARQLLRPRRGRAREEPARRRTASLCRRHEPLEPGGAGATPSPA